MKEIKKDVLLFSGGMDSLVAWEILNRPKCLYVDLGHRYANDEWERAVGIVMGLGPEGVFRFPTPAWSLFEKEDAEIPLRNLYLAMIGVNMGYDNIWIVVQKDEMSIPDRTEEFFTGASNILSMLSGRKIKVDSPFKDIDKVDMITLYLSNGFSIDNLLKTWACYQPDEGKHCGNCPACFRRFVALTLNGITEDWHEKIFESAVAKEYLKKAQEGYYSKERCNHILKALGRTE